MEGGSGLGSAVASAGFGRPHCFLDHFDVLQLHGVIAAQREIDQDAHDLAVLAQEFLRLIEAQLSSRRREGNEVGIGGQPIEFLGDEAVDARQVPSFWSA